jgi:hypothetical protein
METIRVQRRQIFSARHVPIATNRFVLEGGPHVHVHDFTEIVIVTGHHVTRDGDVRNEGRSETRAGERWGAPHQPAPTATSGRNSASPAGASASCSPCSAMAPSTNPAPPPSPSPHEQDQHPPKAPT